MKKSTPAGYDRGTGRSAAVKKKKKLGASFLFIFRATKSDVGGPVKQKIKKKWPKCPNAI